jgi:hypothetical protein
MRTQGAWMRDGRFWPFVERSLLLLLGGPETELHTRCRRGVSEGSVRNVLMTCAQIEHQA